MTRDGALKWFNKKGYSYIIISGGGFKIRINKKELTSKSITGLVKLVEEYLNPSINKVSQSKPESFKKKYPITKSHIYLKQHTKYQKETIFTL